MENTLAISAPVFQDDPEPEYNGPQIFRINFADVKTPVFKEVRGKDYISYGENNKYCDFLTELFNKSGKHNSILVGKANYVFGEGFANGDITVNRLGESLNDVTKKIVLDVRIYGGFRLEIVYNRSGKIGEIYHCDFTTLRKAKDGGYIYKENWDQFNRDEQIPIPSFNPSVPFGTQIFAYDEYRPGLKFYPLPDYVGSTNYIQTDIEISKFYLSGITNGMNPSKLIQFFEGDPGEEGKRTIDKRLKSKFSGAENAGQHLLVFNKSQATKSVEVTDLSGSDLDKMFVELNKTVQQEIFSGHNVTSPALFGIKTEGQLGSTQELKVAYEIFQNTYAKPKASDIDKEITYLLSYSMWPGEYELRPTDPIGVQISDEVMAQAMTPDEVRAKLGLTVVEKPENSAVEKTLKAIAGVSPLVATKILDNLTKNEIRALAMLPPLAEGDYIPMPDGSAPEVVAPTLDSDIKVNSHLKNLSSKQHQELQRIIRQYNKGRLNPMATGALTEAAARVLLRGGLGLTDEEINELLDIRPVPVQLNADDNTDEIIALFDACGDSKNDYEIIKSKIINFESDEDAAEDEEIFKAEAFKTFDVTHTESKIIDLIRSDKRITADVIAKAIGETKKYVESKIASLSKRGYLETTIEKIGADEIIERNVPKGLGISAPPPKDKNVKLLVRYSYDPKPGLEPIIATTRNFCRKLIGLNRFYSRADIETISRRLGYSVWDRKGGWWGNNPECRHRWLAHVLQQKGGDKK